MTQVGEVAAEAREQATGLEQVDSAINQMDEVTRQNAAEVEQSTVASHPLSRATARLSHRIGQFRILPAAADGARRRALQRAAFRAFKAPAAVGPPARERGSAAGGAGRNLEGGGARSPPARLRDRRRTGLGPFGPAPAVRCRLINS